ncbi:hypothetical protein [Saccharopolyspora gregorii]|uniref:hypothetical protein n=1 Tax=Saccharopolyspora gregorii TaxID=33914 RepID=UPI0031E5D3C5
MVDALAAGDGASVYGTVDKLVEAGHDPRRFAADLLDRSATWCCCTRCPTRAAAGSSTRRVTSSPRCRRRASSSAPPRCPGSPRSCTPGCRTCAGPPRRGCCWNCCAPG